MLDWPKRERFRELRHREDEGTLAPEEQDELSCLIQEIEDAEAAYLGPATERLRRENEAVDAQNKVMQSFLTRAEALVERLDSMLARLEEERKGIVEERARLADRLVGAEETAKR